MQIGQHIKQAREALGLSQAEFAKRAKVTQAMVSKLENGLLDPRLSTLNSMLSVLDEELISVNVKQAFHLKREQAQKNNKSWLEDVWISDED